MAIIHAGQGVTARKDTLASMDVTRYGFNVFNEKRERKPGLRISFLDVRVVYARDTVLTTERHGNITEWPLYKEESLQHAFRKEQAAKCIISFQMFEDGEYFAVARLFKEGKVKQALSTVTIKES